MSEIILTFQTQLSGVMETVFKAAIFEITRLVEDSFLEEMSRSREQVESLKKKLQWSESKGRRRCAECGNNKVSSEERREKSSPAQTGVENARILKQERSAEERWRSCGVEKAVELSGMVESEPESSPVKAAEPVVQEEEKLDCMLKSEAVHTATASQLQDEWKLSAEVTEGSDNSAHNKTYSEQELQQIQNDWSSGLDQAPEPEPDMDHIQGLLYRSRYNMEDLGSYSNQELDMGGMNGLADPPQRAGEVLGFGVLPGSLQTDLGTSEECRRQLKNKRGNKGSPSLHNTSDTGDMDCLLINEEGYLQDVSGLSQAQGAPPGDSQGHQIYNRDAVNDRTDCFYSGEAFSQSLELNNGPAGMLGENREDSEHACTQCMISFPDQVSLKAHLNGHRHRNITTSYVCNQCGKKFPQACNLKVHQRVHQREGLHLCSHCGKGYTSFSDLRRHRCSQAGDKPYSCSLCGNKFSRLWNLKLHRRIHTQEKPHRCSMCDKSFTRADILKVHQRTHTGERPYSCRTQLSGVMETILRSAICEITRLVEGSFLEEIGRGKQEAEVLSRRLQILETKLGERERVKRVRCTDCGRTGLSKKDTGPRDPRRQSEGVEVICVTKQEGVSEAGRRICEKGSVTPGQEATSTIPDPELKAHVDGAIVGGAVKEEVAEASGMQIYRSTAHCPITADHRVSQSHNASEISGIHTSQLEHWLPQRDKLPSTSAGNQDSVKQRAQSKKPDSKMEHPVHTSHPQSELTGPASSSVSPTVNQRAGTPESVAIKQEVVVVLPPEWEELNRARTGTMSTTSRDLVVRKACRLRSRSNSRMLVKKQPKPAENANVLASSSTTVNVSRGHSLHKSPPLPKPSQALPQLQRSYTDERAVSALQTGRNIPQVVGIRTHGHIGHHVARTPHICSQCGKGFSHLCHLRAHQQIHTGERQFCCTLCGRSFTKLSNLKAHRRVHTGERPYICMDCGKRFTQKCNLKRHQRIHSAHLLLRDNAVSAEGAVQQRDVKMSDALVVTFQSQLSIVMETILKSAMIEITRLVEDSFMEEVARSKQEVELLLRRLQFSENKLKERENRVRCTDCGRATAGGERITEKAAETLAGEDALCFRLSLREQSEKRPQFSEVWRSTESLGSYRSPETHSDKEKNVNALEKRGKQESTSNTEVQHSQCINAPVTRTHEVCSNPKPREIQCKTPVMDFTSSKDIDLAQSRTIQSATEEDGVGELAPSPSYATVKSEHHPDPVAIKEEEEMLPVWDCGDDYVPAETDQNLAGSWNRDETQSEHSLSIPTEKPHPGKSFAQVAQLKVHMLTHHAGKPLKCPQCAKTFAHDFELSDHQKQHSKERPHICPDCGKGFTRFSNFKQHQNIHTREKLFNCTHCGMRFKRSTHLRIHLRRHSRVGKSCPCRQCGKTFVCLKQLKGHLLKTTQMYPETPPTDLVKMCTINRQRTFSVVAREILTQFQVWQKACYSRNIEWGPITAKIISALPYLSGRETEVIVRCTKMLHNRRDYLRRRAKDATLERNSMPMGQRYLLQLHSGNVIQHA
ncbi:hypothetical protein QTP86_022692 [Hemibagrus guttatus]|nr:hypothetical protein QTP86_022692 [Hemibagrus guttatus]